MSFCFYFAGVLVPGVRSYRRLIQETTSPFFISPFTPCFLNTRFSNKYRFSNIVFFRKNKLNPGRCMTSQKCSTFARVRQIRVRWSPVARAPSGARRCHGHRRRGAEIVCCPPNALMVYRAGFQPTSLPSASAGLLLIIELWQNVLQMMSLNNVIFVGFFQICV